MIPLWSPDCTPSSVCRRRRTRRRRGQPMPRPPGRRRVLSRTHKSLPGRARTGPLPRVNRPLGSGTVWRGEAADEPARADARPTENANCTTTPFRLYGLLGPMHAKMRHWRWQKWGLATAMACVVSAPASDATTIAEKAGSRYRIVVAANAIPSERYAAEELQRYLERMSGAKLPIVGDAVPMQSREILLGDNAHLRKLKLKIDFRRLGTDGFALRTDGKRLIIAGGRPRGTLYGVYALLEEKLGVRWFTPEFEVVPKLQRVNLPKLDETEIPALEYREVYWTEMMRDADFAARHRLNGNHYRPTEKHGGRAAVYYPFVHSFDMLVPRELYQEHPEYFPLIDGKRKDGYVQRCLSNPDVLRIATGRVRQWLVEHPDATIISVSQNDTFNYCQCEK